MKVARLLSLVLGFGALAFTANLVYRTIALPWDLNHIWMLLSFWPRSLIFILSHPTLVMELQPLSYAFLAVQIGTPVFSVILAKLLDRSRLDWFVLALIFPFALTVLAILSRGRASSNPYGGVFGHFFAACTGKFCGRCGKAVPLSARAGQTCPFCGAYWSYERAIGR
jgi:hypothetical protein